LKGKVLRKTDLDQLSRKSIRSIEGRKTVHSKDRATRVSSAVMKPQFLSKQIQKSKESSVKTNDLLSKLKELNFIQDKIQNLENNINVQEKTKDDPE
jgi:uncharacterized protein YlxW (UPF0749 family)